MDRRADRQRAVAKGEIAYKLCHLKMAWPMTT